MVNKKYLLKVLSLVLGLNHLRGFEKKYFKLIKFICTQISLTYFQTMYFPFFLKKNYPNKNHYIICDHK